MKELLKLAEKNRVRTAFALGVSVLALTTACSTNSYTVNDAKPAVVVGREYTPAHSDLVSVKPPMGFHYPASWALEVKQCDKPVGQQDRQCDEETIYVRQQDYKQYPIGSTVVPQEVSVPAPASDGLGF